MTDRPTMLKQIVTYIPRTKDTVNFIDKNFAAHKNERHEFEKKSFMR